MFGSSLLRAAYFLYGSGIIHFTIARAASPSVMAEVRHQLRQIHQVGDPSDSSALPEVDRGIGCDVRPLWRDGANSPGVDLQHEPLAVPVVPLADASKLAPAEWVERMRYAYKMRGCCRSICISDRVTRNSTPGSSSYRRRPHRASSTSW